jgi:hypothetical protein
MIRTIITPISQTVSFEVPQDYVGREIEVLLYAKDELEQQTQKKSGSASRFKGLFTNEEATKFDVFLKKAREEWQRDL